MLEANAECVKVDGNWEGCAPLQLTRGSVGTF